MTCGIYQIRNILNGKKYIGKSRKIECRFVRHKSLLKHNKHFNIHLQKSFNKNGLIAFEFSVIDVCEPEMLTDREQQWVTKYTGELYNEVVDVVILSGPNNPFFGRKHSEDTKAKMSAAKKGKYQGLDNPNYGGKNRNVLIERMNGEKNTNAKLNKEKVLVIKSMLSQGIQTQDQIASLFCVSRTVITKIKSGKLWGHIKENE